ncbi:MAG: glycosyltransferase family 4 protein [Planctomycetota bacterium]|jgi:glycosyltransferase involved in cell wall biosynthesis
MNPEKTIRVAALTGGLNTASTRFRVRQYIPLLAEAGIEVTEHIPYWGTSCGLPSPFKTVSRIPGVWRSRKADVVLISKELVQGYETFERRLKRPRILDIDDAIWLNWPMSRWSQPRIARGMDAIVVGNDYLADYYSRYCSNIHVLPTAIDTDRYLPKPDGRHDEKFVIGWTGQACNYTHLHHIAPALKQFMDNHSDVELLIITNRPFKSTILPAEKIRYVQWTPEIETSGLHQMDVGIMPLLDNNWTRGKCSFKMLQYMASGLPVVVSPVGMNRSVLAKDDCGFAAKTHADWVEALETLYRDRSIGPGKGRVGRAVIEQYYAVGQVARQWSEIFRHYAP